VSTVVHFSQYDRLSITIANFFFFRRREEERRLEESAKEHAAANEKESLSQEEVDEPDSKGSEASAGKEEEKEENAARAATPDSGKDVAGAAADGVDAMGLLNHSNIRSYRYTVAMFPLPYKNVLKYRTRKNVGGISISVFNTKCTRECRPHFAACDSPDRAMGYANQGRLLATRPTPSF
jgi:hypothetical protein